MSRHLGPWLGALALLGAEAAHAADDAAPEDLRATAPNAWAARGRLELGGAFARHDQTVNSGAGRTSASGSAISHLAAGGAWMAERRPLGAAASLELDRFALRTTGVAGTTAMPVTGLDASAGLLGRLGGPGAVAALEGQLGYGLVRVPILNPPTGTPMTTTPGARPATLQAHGPALAVRLTVPLSAGFDLEATGRVLPLLMGARANDRAVDLRRFAGGLGARIGLLDAGTMRLSALAGYQADVVDGGGAVAVHQLQHRIGLGLRASLPQAVPERSAKAPVAAPVAPEAQPAARPVVRGVVRTASKEQDPPPALADVSVTAPGGQTVTTDAEGGFRFDQLAPGLAQLRFSREGFEETAEVVSVPAQGEVVLDIRLRPSAAARSAALIGQVRKEDGAPVEAEVRVLELGLSARADRTGRFRFDIPPGRYTLTIEAPGFVSQRKAAPVGAGEQNIFNVDLQRRR
jgi:hypothetical protein